MACLTGEQLARLALGLDEGERLPAHVEACDTCRTKLAEMHRLTAQLSAVHAELDSAHAAGRSRLLSSLSSIDAPPQAASRRRGPTAGFWGWSVNRRIAAAGIGLSTVIGAVLILLLLTSSEAELSAMDRLAEQLRQAESFSYKLSRTMTSKPGAVHHPLIIQRNDSTTWRAPAPSRENMLGSLYAETKIVHIKGTTPVAKDRQMTVHIEEIHPFGKAGIIIDHLAKRYFRVPPARAQADDSDSPIRMLQVVREGAGEVVRELGTKEIDGKQARGYLVAFKAYAPFRTLDSVEVWLDPETDLPLEFAYEAENEWKRDVFRVTDCRWNIEIDRARFDTPPPEGYVDVTPPQENEALDEIAAALKLYAELSGGHYPRVTQFDRDAIREEMLTMAGFTGPPQAERKHDEKFRRIEEAEAGLGWLARILRNHKAYAGYHGLMVTLEDEDKVLLWWTVWTTNKEPPSYRVFYGDLRSEIVDETRWAELVPPVASP